MSLEAINATLAFETSYNLLQAGAIALGETSPSRYSLINKGKGALLCIDGLSVMWTGMLLAYKLSETYNIGLLFDKARLALGEIPATLLGMTVGLVALTILGIAVFGTVAGINRYSKPQNPNSGYNWERPVDEQLKQAAFVSRIFINVALIYFIPERGLLLGLNAIIEGVTLLKITQRKWLKFEKSELSDSQYFSKVTAMYHFLVQTSKVSPDEKCPVCLEHFNEQSEPEVNFCSSHTFHAKCINDMVKVSSDRFLRGINIKKRTVITTYNRQGGHSTKVDYEIDLPKSAVPCCPLCRERPNHHEFEILIDDRFDTSTTYIDWKEA